MIQGTLNALRKITVEFHVSSQTALDANVGAARETLSIAARQALGTAISALNVSFGGRRLFSGDAGNAQAVVAAGVVMSASVTVLEAGPTAGAAYANLANEFSLAGGLFETTFYTGGGSNAPATEVARGERLDYAPRADQAPVRALLRDLTALAAAFDPDNAIPEDQRRGLAERAIAGLRDNVEALVAMASQVGAAEERMGVVKTRHRASETVLNLAYVKLAGRDQFEAAAELSQLETQLQTTYLATVRLASLSLVNFLR